MDLVIFGNMQTWTVMVLIANGNRQLNETKLCFYISSPHAPAAPPSVCMTTYRFLFGTYAARSYNPPYCSYQTSSYPVCKLTELQFYNRLSKNISNTTTVMPAFCIGNDSLENFLFFTCQTANRNKRMTLQQIIKFWNNWNAVESVTYNLFIFIYNSVELQFKNSSLAAQTW